MMTQKVVVAYAIFLAWFGVSLSDFTWGWARHIPGVALFAIYLVAVVSFVWAAIVLLPVTGGSEGEQHDHHG